MPEDCFVELGFGRGRGLFLVNAFFGCRCIGIEWIEEFFKIAKHVIDDLKHAAIKLYHEDFLTSKHLQGKWIYLHGSCMDEKEVLLLCHNLCFLDCHIITTSFSLSEYDQNFEVLDKVEAEFPFGNVEVFLNKKRKNLC